MRSYKIVVDGHTFKVKVKKGVYNSAAFNWMLDHDLIIEKGQYQVTYKGEECFVRIAPLNAFIELIPYNSQADIGRGQGAIVTIDLL